MLVASFLAVADDMAKLVDSENAYDQSMGAVGYLILRDWSQLFGRSLPKSIRSQTLKVIQNQLKGHKSYKRGADSLSGRKKIHFVPQNLSLRPKYISECLTKRGYNQNMIEVFKSQYDRFLD